MDLRGILEIRPDAVAELCADLPAGWWDHACSHRDGAGGSAVARLAPEAAVLYLRGAEGPEESRRLLSASLLKLRGGGCGVVRLQPDPAAEAQPGWDGSGWLAGLQPPG